MKDGFYAHINHDGELVMGTAIGGTLYEQPPAALVDYLISFIEFDFSSYQAVLEGLLELDIFASSIDVCYDDFDECREYCGIIADGLEDFAGRYFTMAELARNNTIPDDGTASFWLYQSCFSSSVCSRRE